MCRFAGWEDDDEEVSWEDTEKKDLRWQKFRGKEALNIKFYIRLNLLFGMPTKAQNNTQFIW